MSISPPRESHSIVVHYDTHSRYVECFLYNSTYSVRTPAGTRLNALSTLTSEIITEACLSLASKYLICRNWKESIRSTKSPSYRMANWKVISVKSITLFWYPTPDSRVCTGFGLVGNSRHWSIVRDVIHLLMNTWDTTNQRKSLSLPFEASMTITTRRVIQ